MKGDPIALESDNLILTADVAGRPPGGPFALDRKRCVSKIARCMHLHDLRDPV